MIYAFDEYVLDTGSYELRRNGSPVSIEPQVFELLVLLVENHGRVVSKDEILDKVWKGRIVSEAALSSRIKAARQLIGDDGTAQRLIRTVHGRGFCFDGEISTDLPDDKSRDVPREARQTVRYCRAADGTLLAYAISGKGPLIIKTANWLSHLEYEWQSPVWGHWWKELTRHNELVRYDQRGTGLSDWNVQDFGFDAYVRDLEAVVDAVGAKKFSLLGLSQGCAVSVAYAAMYPERVSSMVLYGGYATGWQARGDKQEIARRHAMVELTRAGWGQDNPAFRQIFATLFMPQSGEEQARWFNDLARITASPENAARLQLGAANIDIRPILEQVRAPTLVIHQRGDAVVPVSAGRFLAANIPGARFVELEGSNHIILEDEPSWPRFVRETLDFFQEHQDR